MLEHHRFPVGNVLAFVIFFQVFEQFSLRCKLFERLPRLVLLACQLSSEILQCWFGCFQLLGFLVLDLVFVSFALSAYSVHVVGDGVSAEAKARWSGSWPEPAPHAKARPVGTPHAKASPVGTARPRGSANQKSSGDRGGGRLRTTDQSTCVCDLLKLT